MKKYLVFAKRIVTPIFQWHILKVCVFKLLNRIVCFQVILNIFRWSLKCVIIFLTGVICMACHESGDLSQLLLCTSCSNYYHGTCMDPPILPSPDLRAGWQCLDCKVCQNCRYVVIVLGNNIYLNFKQSFKYKID